LYIGLHLVNFSDMYAAKKLQVLDTGKESIMIQEIKARNLNTEKFIAEKTAEIQAAVGKGMAINALSGGVDSSVVTMLGHMALGKQLRTVIIDNGIMREGEPEQVAAWFKKLGVKVEIIDARKEFFAALKGLTDPEEKREAITQTFYKKVFGRIVRESRDARTARPTRLPWALLEGLAAEILKKVPGVVSVTYNIATKPPSTIEAV